MGQGGGGGGAGSGNAAWSIVWLIILLLVGIWISGLCAGIYILLNIFTACIEGLNPVCEVLLKGVQATGTISKFMMEGTPINEAFK